MKVIKLHRRLFLPLQKLKMLTTEGKLNFYFKASKTPKTVLVQTYAAWQRESTQVVEEGQEEQAVPSEYMDPPIRLPPMA